MELNNVEVVGAKLLDEERDDFAEDYVTVDPIGKLCGIDVHLVGGETLLEAEGVVVEPFAAALLLLADLHDVGGREDSVGGGKGNFPFLENFFDGFFVGGLCSDVELESVAVPVLDFLATAQTAEAAIDLDGDPPTESFGFLH